MERNAIAGAVITLASFAAAPALAEFERVAERDDFIRLVEGKTLSRPFVRLEVSPAGAISGTGAGWDVNGDWSWQDGFFCRDLFWGGDPLGYNCQEVRANGNSIRFTSDQGSGQSADFRLR